MQHRFFALISRMRYIGRWGLMRNTFEENIQEHSHMVAVLAHGLAVIQRDILGQPADPDRCASAALFHDASEILTGDLPTPIKYYNPEIKSAYKQIEAVSCEKLLALGCTAIIVSNGVMACDVAYYCMQHHTKAALVGYVDSPLQSRMAPYFASVFLPTEELGRCAGQEILRLMANPGAVPQAVRLPAQFRPSAQAGAAPCCKPEQEP